MPRQAREIVRGEYYHILTRGNNRRQLFYAEGDFEYYLQALLKYRLKYEVSVYHYCLMSNHVHLLMRSETADDGIPRLMHDLQTSYALYFLKRNGVTGHIFENRYKDFRIDKDAYLLECGRYIERNPVRAGMVKDAGEYVWSSYRHYGEGKKDSVLSPDPLYESLGHDETERQREYRRYVMTHRAYEDVVDRFFDERALM